MSLEEKARGEEEAMAELRSAAAGCAGVGVVFDRWREYEDPESAEAVFVRDMNLIDMCVQALLYEWERRYDVEETRAVFPDHEQMDEFFASARMRLATETGHRLFRILEAEYRAHLAAGEPDPE